MESIRLAPCPSSRTTRTRAMRSLTVTVPKPHLSPRPSSRRAVVGAVEAVVTRLPVRAALGVDGSSTPSTSTMFCRDTFAVMGDLTPIERLGWGPRAAPHRPDDVGGIPDLRPQVSRGAVGVVALPRAS